MDAAPGAAAAAFPPPLGATQPALPFLGDDIFVLIATELDARMLGRLGCVAQRFWRPSVPDPAHQGRAKRCAAQARRPSMRASSSAAMRTKTSSPRKGSGGSAWGAAAAAAAAM